MRRALAARTSGPKKRRRYDIIFLVQKDFIEEIDRETYVQKTCCGSHTIISWLFLQFLINYSKTVGDKW